MYVGVCLHNVSVLRDHLQVIHEFTVKSLKFPFGKHFISQMRHTTLKNVE